MELRGLEVVIVYASSDLLEPLVNGCNHAIKLAQVSEICSSLERATTVTEGNPREASKLSPSPQGSPALGPPKARPGWTRSRSPRPRSRNLQPVGRVHRERLVHKRLPFNPHFSIRSCFFMLLASSSLLFTGNS